MNLTLTQARADKLLTEDRTLSAAERAMLKLGLGLGYVTPDEVIAMVEQAADERPTAA